MCDVYSLASAGSDFMGGIAGSIDAKSAASFEAAQLDAMKTLTAARASDAEGQLRRSYADQTRQNAAAAAISGFAAISFASVNEGNAKDLQKNMAKIVRDTDMETMNLTIQQMEAKLEGKRRASAALFSGINSGLSTLHDAERSYREYHTGESRWAALMKSAKGGA